MKKNSQRNLIAKLASKFKSNKQYKMEQHDVAAKFGSLGGVSRSYD